MQHFQELYWHFPELSNSTMSGNFPAQLKMKETHHAILFKYALVLLPPPDILSTYKGMMFPGNNVNSSSVEKTLTFLTSYKSVVEV